MDAQSLPRLTDQARVAVSLAQSLTHLDERSASHGPNVAHLIAGLAGEPEGIAGLRIRQHAGEVAARLVSHPSVGARSLPRLDTVAVALPVMSRPAWTVELLRAAVRVGGEDLRFLLGECGVSLSQLPAALDPTGAAGHPDWMPSPATVTEDTTSPETFGLGSLRVAGYSAHADRIVAIARAQGGDSHTLIAWIGPDEETTSTLLAAPPIRLSEVIALRAERGGSTDVDDLVVAITNLSIRATFR